MTETGAVVRTGFVDRVEHMDELRSLLADGTEGRGGRAIVIDSVSGMGKSALLRAFEAEAAASRAPGVCRVVALTAGGVRQEARELLERARHEVARKAELVTDDVLRDRNLTQVRLKQRHSSRRRRRPVTGAAGRRDARTASARLEPSW